MNYASCAEEQIQTNKHGSIVTTYHLNILSRLHIRVNAALLQDRFYFILFKKQKFSTSTFLTSIDLHMKTEPDMAPTH